MSATSELLLRVMAVLLVGQLIAFVLLVYHVQSCADDIMKAIEKGDADERKPK